MSVFDAIDKLNELANIAFIEEIGLSQLNNGAPPLNSEKLNEFINRLKSIANEDKYDELKDIISGLKTYAEQVKRQDFPAIIEALEVVDQKYQQSIALPDANKAYRDKYSKGLVAEICQGSQYELGTSKGECFGFTMAMADPELSPYEQPRSAKPISMKLTEQIHEYQKSQENNGLKKMVFKGAIVQPKKYCFGGKSQASLILATGKKNAGKHLNVELSEPGKTSGHSCYFKYEQDPTNGNATIRYADPNGSAHEFNNENDFLEHYATFFEDAYNHQGISDEKDFHFVTINSFKKTNDELELSDQEKENANRSPQATSILNIHYTPPKGWGNSYKSKALSTLHSFQSNVIYPIDKFKCKIGSLIKKEIAKSSSDMAKNFQQIKKRFLQLVGGQRQAPEQHSPTPHTSPEGEDKNPEQEETNSTAIKPG